MAIFLFEANPFSSPNHMPRLINGAMEANSWGRGLMRTARLPF